MTASDKFEELIQTIQNCKKCGLHRTRINPVIGEGSSKAEIMFIGEAPGFHEDKKGNPFVGQAGKVFDELLDSINIKREGVYITNILKCRPPGNRNPRQEEIDACTPYLDKQIRIIGPKVICCLGNFATEFIMKKFDLKEKIQRISRISGKVFSVNNLSGSVKIVPLYHPAVATYNRNMLDVLKKDFEILKQIMQ